MVGHNGADAGYRADVARFPDQQLAITTLCNAATIQPGALTRKAAEIILGPDVFAPLAPGVSMEKGEIADLVGIYWNPVTDDIRRIGSVNGQLLLDGGAVTPLGGGRFRVGGGPAEVVFPPATDGKPQELRASQGANATFTRVATQPDAGFDLRPYVGEYRSDELDVIYNVAMLPDSRLAILRPKYGPSRLTPIKPDMFFGAGVVTFLRAPSGELTGFTVSTGRVRRLLFTRIPAANQRK